MAGEYRGRRSARLIDRGMARAISVERETHMSTHSLDAIHRSSWSRLGALIVDEIREVIPPTLFFFVGFNLVLFTKRLFLEQYLIAYAGFFVATTGALIVGKVVLVANKMPLLRRFDYAPLAYPILFKTIVYTALVGIARLLETLIHYLAADGALGGGGFIEHVFGTWSWPRFIATQMWIFVLFLVWVTATELNELLGEGELFRIFFTRRSSALKSTRRARIRLLTQLSRLTDAYPVAVLEDPKSAPHRELVAILRRLVQDNAQTRGA
jgi:hypothetical protein